MRFQFVVTVKDLLINEGQSLEVQIGGPHKVTALLRRASTSEAQQGHEPTKTFCVAESCWEPVSEKITQAFAGLAAHRLPQGWERASGWEWQVDEEGQFKEVDIVSLELLPQHFQDWRRSVYDELHQASQRVVNIVRWRRGLHGPHNPVAAVSFQWSEDGIAWRHMPSSFGAVVEVVHGQSFQAGFGDEVAALMAQGGDQPLAHELLREAWSNRIFNPRSSLLMGVAAAEVGLKQCIAALVPDAGWLVHNVPSPPVEKMLNEYLPRLSAKLTFGGKVLTPPKPVMDALKKGIMMRNLFTHKGAKAPEYESLNDVLLAVRDLLWLLDHYCGFGWALDHLREGVRQLLPSQSGVTPG